MNKHKLIFYLKVNHESSKKLSQLSNKIRIGAFGLLELETWAKN